MSKSVESIIQVSVPSQIGNLDPAFNIGWLKLASGSEWLLPLEELRL